MSNKVDPILGAYRQKDNIVTVAGGLNPLGAYNNATAYALGDSVDYQGSSYIALGATTGNTPPNATYWEVLASKGNTGATGATGTTGATGAAGIVQSVNGYSQATIVLTTADIADSSNKRYVTDAELTVLGNTSGTNTGDQTLAGLGGVPTTRTVNGHALSADVSVTSTDVGLSNVTNVAQLPLSYLDTDGTLAANSDSKVPSQKAVKTYTDGLVVGLLDDRGNYDASSNLFPSTGGSGTAGAILKGDIWYISVAGTLGGVSVTIGSSVRALVDTPGQTAGNWDILNVGLGYTPENSANKVTSISGSSTDVQYPSAKLLYDQLATKQATGAYLTGVTVDSPLSGAGTSASHLTVDLSSKENTGVAAGLISTHAALTTGVHGLAITAGQTLTVTTGGTLGSAAYTASTAYDASGAASTVQGNLTTHIGNTGTAVHGLGTISTQAASSVAITGGTLSGLTGLAIRDTSAAFDVTLAATSSTALTAGRTLTIDLVNTASTIKLGYNLTLSAAATIGGTNTGDVALASPNHGLSLSGQTLALGTPSTLTTSTTNAVTTTTHTHAITSSSAPGAAASLLATDSSGIIGSTGTRIVKGWFTDLTVTNAVAADITGTAAKATILATARTIGGTSFDGSANITVTTATGGFTVSGGNLTIDTSTLFVNATTHQIGIGTTSPATTFHVNESGAAPTGGYDSNTIAIFQDTSSYAGISIIGKNTNNSFILFGDSDDTDIGRLIYDHTGNYMAFWTNNAEGLRITSGADVYTNAFADYTASSTITGFTGAVTGTVYTKRVGKLCHVWYAFSGASNQTYFTFTVPYNAAAAPAFQFFAWTYGIDNSVDLTSPGRVYMTANSNVVTLNKTLPGGVWTASNSKAAYGYFAYQTA